MAKTQEELKELKEKYESLNNKLKELTEDELRQVTGGDSHAPRGYTDWKKVYSYLQEHKNNLPEALKIKFESFDDEHDPHFQYFVEENVNTNEVVLAAWNYGTIIVPR